MQREPVTIVEIEQDFCERTYGRSPCAAVLGTDGNHKCFNSYQTCQDRGNYSAPDSGRLKLHFAFPREGLPSDSLTYFPALRSVSSTPTELNPGGLSRRSRPLGKRASVTIVIDDFPWDDRIVDKYAAERKTGAAQSSGTGYDPATRSTFWQKWRTRNLHHLNRPVTIYEGNAGEALAEMTKRRYFIDRIEGPTRGQVRIIAKDVLKLAEDESALVPRPSKGRLAADLAEDAGRDATFSVVPAGAGDEYPSSGRVAIGNELIAYHRTGDEFRIVTRGSQSTISGISAHAQDDIVQACWQSGFLGGVDEPEGNIVDIIIDILTSYANVPAEFIDEDGEWAREKEQWLPSHDFRRAIVEPTPVLEILGELSLIGPYIWWDERIQKIRLRAIRPEVSNFSASDVMTDDNALIRDPVVKEFPKERISQIFLYYQKVDVFGSDDPENYARLHVVTDLASESDDEYGQGETRTIFSPWLKIANAGIVASIAQNLIYRNRDVPVEISIDVDARWREKWTGDVIALRSEKLPNSIGLQKTRLYQILSAREDEPGEHVAYTLWPSDYSQDTGTGGEGGDDTDEGDEFLPDVGRYGFVEPNDQPVYATATEEQRAPKAGYIADDDGHMSDGSPGWVIF